jgi:hypothetical protein
MPAELDALPPLVAGCEPPALEFEFVSPPSLEEHARAREADTAQTSAQPRNESDMLMLVSHQILLAT